MRAFGKLRRATVGRLRDPILGDATGTHGLPRIINRLLPAVLAARPQCAAADTCHAICLRKP